MYYNLHKGGFFMAGNPIVIEGIAIPFSSPVLLAVVAIHVLAGLLCVVSGVGAMLGRKGDDRHRIFGRVYFMSFMVVFITAAVLSAARWREDYYLFIIGAAAFASAFAGRSAVKRPQVWRIKTHITGMGLSFILLLTAFYLDNGANLPVWKNLPHFMYWLLPFAAGIPITMYAAVKYKNFKKGR
jgi:uncharacterized membrane protein